jgi:5-methylcytosine-specific restriction protein A
VWLPDELILALDLYVREGRSPPKASVDQLSSLLRDFPIERELAADPKFRNPPGVQLKIYNFAAIDPASPIAGMPHGGRGDQTVWDEFADDPARLTAAANAIRANFTAPVEPHAVDDEEEIGEAPEGALLTRVHRVRERSRKLVAQRKEQALSATGSLACEACGFDFAKVYGPHGEGFIECHHTLPVSKLTPGSRTKLQDLALVCANCHRMIHRRSPWLSVSALKELLSSSPV